MSLVLPRTEWPHADRAMWDALCNDAGPLDEPGGLAHLRQTSRDTLEVRYGRWLKWLDTTDPNTLLLPPAERPTLSRLQAWQHGLAHTKPMSRLMFVDGVIRVLREVAPDQDWTMPLRLLVGLKRAAGRGDPARKNGRVLSSTVLLKAGLSHANLDADAVPNQLQRSLGQRDGTMIALLSVLPMRRRAFCELALGQSIHVSATQIMILLLVTYYMEGNFKTRSDFVDGVDIGARADGCFKGNVDLMWVGSFD